MGVESELGRIEHDALATESTRLELWDGLMAAVATTVPLVVGAVVDQRVAGLTVALAALNGALSTPVAPRRTQLRWGAAAIVTCTLSATLASAVGGMHGLFEITTLLVVAATTLLRRYGRYGALLGFSTSAVFVIMGGLPTHEPPLDVFIQFVVGGGLAVGLLVAVSRRDRVAPAPEPSLPAWSDPALVLHALRVALAVTLATVLEEWAGLHFGYWVPLTTLAVLQPQRHASLVRVVQRCLGTLAGVALVAVATLLTGAVGVLIALAGLCSFVLFTVRERSYTWIVLALTPTALLMISTVAYDGWEIAGLRLLNTLYGVIVALVVTAGAWMVDGLLERWRATPAT